MFSLICLKISVWATARKDESLLFASEACKDVDGLTRWGNLTKAVQKSAPMEPGNPIFLIAVNLPHKRRRQRTHRQPISRGQLRSRYRGWSLWNPRKREPESVKNTRWSVQDCNHLDAKKEMQMYQRGMYGCYVTNRFTMWMYRIRSCSHVFLEPHKKQFAVYIYSTLLLWKI